MKYFTIIFICGCATSQENNTTSKLCDSKYDRISNEYYDVTCKYNIVYSTGTVWALSDMMTNNKCTGTVSSIYYEQVENCNCKHSIQANFELSKIEVEDDVNCFCDTQNCQFGSKTVWTKL